AFGEDVGIGPEIRFRVHPIGRARTKRLQPVAQALVKTVQLLSFLSRVGGRWLAHPRNGKQSEPHGHSADGSYGRLHGNRPLKELSHLATKQANRPQSR